MTEDHIVIEQSRALCGTVELAGAKNAVLVIMSSLILTDGKSVLTNVPANDAGVVSIDAPASPTVFGAQNVTVTIHNYGTSNLNNATINWKVNGVTQTPFNWTGNLGSTQSLSNVNIGTYNFSLGTFNFKVWSTIPNGAADLYHLNDTAYKIIDSYEPLNGIYTIGGTAPDFATFTIARNALNLWGVSGPVTFKVRTGTYAEKIKLTAYTGASAINTVCYRVFPR